MREGLVLLQVPGRYWAVTLVAWARRREGDEWELLGARSIRRIGQVRTLAWLAENGPVGHVLGEPGDEWVHRFQIRRPRLANPKAWLELCPRPDGWVER